MTHTTYGVIIDSGIPHEDGLGTEGMVALNGAVNITDMITLPARVASNGTATSSGSGMELLALQLTGEVLGTKGAETLSVTFAIPWMDAGKLAALLMNAASRSNSAVAKSDFAIGYVDEQRGENDPRKGNPRN